ncbi:MAG: dihydroorotate dehydrogenase [Actinomycetia bacterium]|nr:dihydroorotate dehydrogenase [Actinomycetes bacterium]MCP4084583.1 dihydroorotate dehydrogenase [Actinomycetes bacterium]
MTPDMTTRIGSIELPNPIMTASGTAGHGAELSRYVELDELGALVVKSLASFPWEGNPAPRVHATAAGMINSVGLQGPGVARWLDEELPEILRHTPRVVASIWGRTVADYAEAAALLATAPPEVIAVEVNVSCPNTEDQSRMFAHSPDATGEVVEATEVCGRPRWAKLSPNTSELVEIAAAASDAGAEAVTIANTLLGLVIDPVTRRPVLGAGGGGLSGPAVHPVAVRKVFDCHAELPDLPIIGVGGVATVGDAVEFMLAGASAVQVGTASFADPAVTGRLAREIATWGAEAGVTRLDEVVGSAHTGS